MKFNSELVEECKIGLSILFNTIAVILVLISVIIKIPILAVIGSLLGVLTWATILFVSLKIIRNNRRLTRRNSRGT